jgi:hypothetical protein
VKEEKSMAADGTYNITLTTPMGPQQARLTLKSDGGSLSGVYESAMGLEEFSGGVVDGNRCEWSTTARTPMGPLKLKVSAAVDGDKISGTAVTSFGTATFEGLKI